MADVVDKLERLKPLVADHAFNAQYAPDIIDEAKAEILRLRSLLEWRPIDKQAMNGDRWLIAYRSGGGPLVTEATFETRTKRFQTGAGPSLDFDSPDLIAYAPLPSPPQGEGK